MVIFISFGPDGNISPPTVVIFIFLNFQAMLNNNMKMNVLALFLISLCSWSKCCLSPAWTNSRHWDSISQVFLQNLDAFTVLVPSQPPPAGGNKQRQRKPFAIYPLEFCHVQKCSLLSHLFMDFFCVYSFFFKQECMFSAFSKMVIYFFLFGYYYHRLH